MTVKCATRVGTTNVADSSGAISNDLTHWYGYTITSGAGARSSISRWNYPAMTGITTIVSGLPVHAGATMGQVVGQGGNLFWLEVSGGITYLLTVPMAGGTPSTIWDSSTAGFAGIVNHLSADPVNGGVLLADQVFVFAGFSLTVTEQLIAVDAAGTGTVRFSRTDAYGGSGRQLFNGVHDSRNIGLVVASDGAVWGFVGQAAGPAIWRWDGAFSFSATLAFTPHHMAPANAGQIRIQDTVGTSSVYGMGPPMTLDATGCGFDFETGAPIIGFGDGGTIAYGVSDSYRNIVYWSDAGLGSNGPWQLNVGGWSVDILEF